MARGTDPRIELRVVKGAIVRRDGRALHARQDFTAPAREAWDLIRGGYVLPRTGMADQTFYEWLEAEPPEVRDLPYAPSSPSRRSRPETVVERRMRSDGDEVFADEVARQQQHMPSPPPGLIAHLLG